MLWLLTLLLASLLLMVAWWQHWRWTHRRMLELAAKVPGPPAWPIIGNSLLFLTNPDEQLNKLTELSQKYGDYFKFWLGPDLNICVKNPEDIRLLLTSSKANQKGPVYDLMKKYIGPGILTGGPTWRNHRKIATPSYNKKCVKLYAAIFNEEAEGLAKLLCSQNPGVSIDIYDEVVRTTTLCVCQTLMGLSKEDSKNVERIDEIVSTTQRMYSHIFNKMTRWWLQIPLIYWLLGEKGKENYYLKAIDDLSADIVKRRRMDLEKIGVDNEEALGIVDRYILSGELSEQEMKWETFSLFTTSQEASAKIASGVLMFLAHLPEWQEKVYTEITEVLGAQDGPVTVDHLKLMHHLDMVYKETLRFFSIAAMIQRTVEDEVAINDGKIILPAGTSLIIPIHDLHRDPRYWLDPYKVMPERFLPENVAKRNPNAFVPFSLGAMDCLGRVYATTLIKILVVRVLQKVQLEGSGSLDNLALEVAISVKPVAGYHLRVKPRRESNGRIHRYKLDQ